MRAVLSLVLTRLLGAASVPIWNNPLELLVMVPGLPPWST